MAERLPGLAIGGDTAGQIIHNPSTDAEKLQVVEAFLARPLPEECKEWGSAFNQDACDKWVGEAFPVKDAISDLINTQSISSEEALRLVGRWERLLGYDRASSNRGFKRGRVPYSIYTGGQQGLHDPQKPGSRYEYVDYHNRAVQPDAPHAGYRREGLGLLYSGLEIEDYKGLLPQLKAGRLVGLDYGGSDLRGVFGALQSDASLAVKDKFLTVQMTVVDISDHWSPKERTRHETAEYIVSEQSGRIFKNVFDMLVRRKRGDYEKNDRERNGELITRVLLEHKEKWQALHDPALERDIITYIEKVVADREEAEQGRLKGEAGRRTSWLTKQEHLIGELALLTANGSVD